MPSSASSSTDQRAAARDDDQHHKRIETAADGAATEVVARQPPSPGSSPPPDIVVRDPTMIVFAPDGDLVVLVGPSWTPFKVRSRLLKRVSTAFAAKIELALPGLTAAKRPSPILSLPDDNPAAFEILCGILHQKSRRIAAVDADDMLRLAVLAKKYGCTDHVFPVTNNWFRHIGPTSSATEWKLLAAACLLGNSEWFQRCSNRLTQQYRASFLAFVKNSLDEVLALRLCLAMEEKRTRDGHILDPSSPRGVLCLECFKAATTSFAPNLDCESCTAFPSFSFSSSLNAGAIKYV